MRKWLVVDAQSLVVESLKVKILRFFNDHPILGRLVKNCKVSVPANHPILEFVEKKRQRRPVCVVYRGEKNINLDMEGFLREEDLVLNLPDNPREAVELIGNFISLSQII